MEEKKYISLERLTKYDELIKTYTDEQISKIAVSQPDWNQNDISAPDFIKNRPFYTEVGGGPLVVDNYELAVDDDGMGEIPGFDLLEGSGYIVTWNGVDYHTVCESMDGLPWIGNIALGGMPSNGSDAPFIMVGGEYGKTQVMTTDPSPITVSISAQELQIHKIDEKYLPTLVGKDVSGLEFEIDGNTVVANDGAEIFNSPWNIATGYDSHAEGYSTTATGWVSHAEGYSTVASNDTSHAEGSGTVANGVASHAEGFATIASGAYQHVEGIYNIEDANLAHIIGNGSNVNTRSNAHTVDWNGNAWFQGDIKIGGSSYADTTAKTIATEEYVDTQIEEVTNNIDLSNYYTKTETDNLELITVDDIDAICGGAIQYAEDVMF